VIAAGILELQASEEIGARGGRVPGGADGGVVEACGHLEGFKYAYHTSSLSESLRGMDNGKLYVIKSVFSIDCGGLGATFLSYHFLAVKRFLT
jgi:hypothetical protein